MTPLPCAKCPGALKPYLTVGPAVDRCDRCRGLFFERGELVRLLSDGELSSVRGEDGRSTETGMPHAAADSAPASCPRCRIPMGRLEAGTGEGFAYDICPACNSLWLDAGELAFLEKSNLRHQERVAATPDAARRRGIELIAEIEAQVEFIDEQRRKRLGRLDRMMQFGLSDAGEILRIREAIETEAEVARRSVSEGSLFEEARKLTVAGALSGSDFEALRRRLGVRA